MLKRTLEPHLHRLAGGYPAITITGPRQSGKTTLARSAFSHLPYTSLEDPDTRRFAQEDPRGFLGQFPEGAIFDEIQNTPELLSYLQGILDSTDKTGRFILTGSQNFTLSRSIAQSLAGRTAIATLLPLALAELESGKATADVDHHLHHGFYPRLRTHDALEPARFYADYYQSYIQRDVRDLAQIRDLDLFDRFVRLCAGRIGQPLNLSSLANDAGVTRVTADNWFLLLETSFLLYRLQPYYRNHGKRLTKSAKLYFYDVGLATYLLGIQEQSQLAAHPLRGSLFENLVITDLHKQRLHQAQTPNFTFYRDSNANEVDCLCERSNQIDLIEIKSSQTFNTDYLKGIKAFERFIKPPYEIGNRYIAYAGESKAAQHNTQLLSPSDLSRLYHNPQS
jgi:predicted AAA+ superfamily ATPase